MFLVGGIVKVFGLMKAGRQRRVVTATAGLVGLALVAGLTGPVLAGAASSKVNPLGIMKSQTYPGTWDWTGANVANFNTPSSDQEVVVFTSGLATNNKNAAAILRYSSASDLLRAKVDSVSVALEDGQGILKTVTRNDGATAGTIDASVVGSAVSIKWNGIEVLTYTLTRSQTGTACGVQVWQDVANSVPVGAVCTGVLGGTVLPVTPPTTNPVTSLTTTKPVVTTTTAKPVVTTTTAKPVATTVVNPGDKSPGWLSGASGPDASNGGFGAWRGAAVEVSGTWVNDPALYTMTGSGELVNFQGPVDVGISPPDWQGWQAEANGVHDAFYQQMFTNLKNARAGKGTVYVRPWYEFNGNWMSWSVPAGQEPLFKQAWIRMAGVARTAFPGVKLVYCAAASGGADVQAAFPGRQYVDVGGIDFYNNWPWVNTQAGFDDKVNNGAGASSMEKLRLFYQSQGIPFAVDEWSNKGVVTPTSQGGGGESPQFVDMIHTYFQNHAGTGPGQLLYEVMFNLHPAEFQMFPANQTVQPQTAAEYAKVF